MYSRLTRIKLSQLTTTIDYVEVYRSNMSIFATFFAFDFFKSTEYKNDQYATYQSIRYCTLTYTKPKQNRWAIFEIRILILNIFIVIIFGLSQLGLLLWIQKKLTCSKVLQYTEEKTDKVSIEQCTKKIWGR